MEEKQYLFRPHVKSYTHVFQICTEVALKLSWTKNEMIFVAYTIFYALICMILWYWYSYFKLFRNIVIVDIHIFRNPVQVNFGQSINKSKYQMSIIIRYATCITIEYILQRKAKKWDTLVARKVQIILFPFLITLYLNNEIIFVGLCYHCYY